MAAAPRIEQIKASAGSGKTYALTQRFLRLLSGAGVQSGQTACAAPGDARNSGSGDGPGYGWTDILAATFTNKAADEMRGRVLERLKRHALNLETRPEPGWSAEKAAFWVDMLLRRYGSLNIRTIDSLLLNLVRLCALELGLPPGFEPAFAWLDYFDPLYSEALNELALDEIGPGEAEADNARPDPTARAELGSLLHQAFSDLVYHTEMKGFSPSPKFNQDLAALFDLALVEGPLPVCPVRDLARKRAVLAEEAASTAADMLACIEEEGLAANATFLKHLRTYSVPVRGGKLPDTVWPGKESLDDCLNKASKGTAGAGAEAAFAAYCRAWTVGRRTMEIYSQAIGLAPLAALANLLAERLPEFQRRTGLVPHVLTPTLAGKILEESAASEAFCRMGVRIAHILVDEFQDTSRAQWAAIAPLAEECLSTGGSLTLVGDVKQAIYRWRGGDAALFDEVPASPALTTMLEGAPEFTALEHNWRSCPAVVEHNNRVFEPLEAPETALDVVLAMLPANVPNYVASDEVSTAAGLVAAALSSTFRAARQRVPERPAVDGAGYVSLQRVSGDRMQDLYDNVCERLRVLFLEDIALRRNWRDVAVLVYKNSEAEMVAGWLMEWGVPVVTDQSLSLAGHPLIRQITAFLTCMDNPADDVAFWALLTAHADGRESLLGAELLKYGLPWPVLRDWLADSLAGQQDISGPKFAGRGTLSSRFRAAYPAVWEDVFAPFHNRSGLIGPYDAVAELLARFEVMHRFAGEDAYIRRFLEVVHSTEGQGMAALSAFLEHWADQGGVERVPMPEALDAVRVMTMHKAKGLQFPVVIVPFHHQSAGGLPPVRMQVDGLELLARPHAAQGAAYYQAFAENAVERIHVLYVAWTRAVEELHGFLTSTRQLAGNPLVKGVNALLRAAGIDPDQDYESGQRPVRASGPEKPGGQDSQAEPPQSEQSAPVPEQQNSAVIANLPEEAAPGESWQPMQWLPRLKIFRSPVRQLLEMEESPRLTEAQRGLFVHDCLERLLALRPFAPGHAPAAINSAVSVSGAAFPLAVPLQLQEEAAAMLEWFVKLPEAALWLARGKTEQSILDEEGALHRADLLVRDGNKQVVVEYKTGGKSDAHTVQVRRYLSLLSRMNERDGNTECSGRIVYLDSREVERVEVE